MFTRGTGRKKSQTQSQLKPCSMSLILLVAQYSILTDTCEIPCYGKEWRLPSDGDVICNTKTEATKTQPCERLRDRSGACSNFFKVTKPRMENLHKANIQIQFAAYFIINFFSKLLFSVFRVPNRFSLFRKCV